VDVDAEKGGPEEPIKLVLARPAVLSGLVVDEQGNPVPGAQVRLESEELFSVGEVEARADLVRSALRKGEEGIGSLGVTTGPVPPIPTADEPDMIGGEAWLSAITDGAGQFRFDMLAPGKYQVVAREGAHAESKEQTVELVSGQLEDDVTLRLREGAPLTGRVLDGNGQPLVGVSIEAGGEFFFTDESGSFDLGLRRGKVRVIARAPGMVPQAINAKVKGKAIDLAIALEPADGAVDLRLVDANGTPIKDVEVVLQSRDGLTPTVIAWSDDGGRVQFENLTPGKTTIRLGHPDYVMQEYSLKVDHRSAALEISEVKLDRGWSVEVLVRAKASGERLKGALVVVDGRATTTDKDGKAIVTRLEAKRVDLAVSLAGWAPTKQRAKRPEDRDVAEVLVELDEVGSLEGSLRDDIGDPVVGATLEAFDQDGKNLAKTKSGPGGKYRFDALPEGSVRIVAPPPPAQAELWEVAEVESDVRRSETTKEVHLRFERR
jgi:protocatechuate 3,4-dioxygenase beta subunit